MDFSLLIKNKLDIFSSGLYIETDLRISGRNYVKIGLVFGVYRFREEEQNLSTHYNNFVNKFIQIKNEYDDQVVDEIRVASIEI